MNILRSKWNAALGLVRNLSSMAYDQYAMQKLKPLYCAYLPWTRATMRPRAIELCCNAVALIRPEIVVECGGGNSTFFVRSLLRQSGYGRLITIEENSNWAMVLSRQLEEHGLSGYGQIVCAPLKPAEKNGVVGIWYDEEILRPLLESAQGSIGVLIIDGPTGQPTESRRDLSRRYFAVPFFQDYLAPEYFVLLDDTNRAGESTCLRLWRDHCKMRFTEFGVSGACAYFSNSPLLLD